MSAIEQLLAKLADDLRDGVAAERRLVTDRLELHSDTLGRLNERIAALECQPTKWRASQVEQLVEVFVEQRERVKLLEDVVDAARDFHAQVIRRLADPAAPLVDRLTEQLTRLNASEMRFGG